MCEILLLYYLGKKISEMAGDKGRSNVPYVLMFVLFWFGGEVCGGDFGAILIHGQDDKMMIAYVCALIGAAVGTGLSFLIVGLLPPVSDDEDRPRPRRRRPRVRTSAGDYDDDDDRPRRRRRDEDEDEDRPRRRRANDDGSFEQKRDL